MSAVAARLAPFGTTIFTEMTRLAVEHNAVNLAQGFPDFDGPEFLKHAAIEAIIAGRNQYARMTGDPSLNRAIAANWQKRTSIALDPDAQVTVTSGCTEAIAATMLGILNPGDKVILFEPYYDSYRACVSMAGATPVFVPLHPPADAAPGGISNSPFSFKESDLRLAFESKPRAIVINTPHNPTGKVFTHQELSLIASLCTEHRAIAITDEVYEHLLFDPGLPHLLLATFPGMAERTVTLSSLGKTFSLTGWKIGWAIASPKLSAAVRAAHQFLTFATSTPMQHAAALALTSGEAYISELVSGYRAKRDFLAQALASLGMRVYQPAGTYFIMADHSPLKLGTDVEFCRHLTTKVGVAAIPPSVFYNTPSLGAHLVRLAFCKKQETLDEAVRRLAVLNSA